MIDRDLTEIDLPKQPEGELSLQTVSMPADTNPMGDIFSGWMVAQMDLACTIRALHASGGRVVTVSIEKMNFMVPVPVGAVICCYTKMLDIGNSSMRIQIQVWQKIAHQEGMQLVTQGIFVLVAVNAQGKTRKISIKKKN